MDLDANQITKVKICSLASGRENVYLQFTEKVLKYFVKVAFLSVHLYASMYVPLSIASELQYVNTNSDFKSTCLFLSVLLYGSF